MKFKYTLKILIIIFIIFSLIIFLKSFGINFNEVMKPKKLLEFVTIEGLELQEKQPLSSPIGINGSDAFCDYHKGFNLETSCNKLTKNNCNSTKCCIWTSDAKCKAGNQEGPTFNSNKKGQTMSLDYYYYQNKCYGEKCS